MDKEKLEKISFFIKNLEILNIVRKNFKLLNEKIIWITSSFNVFDYFAEHIVRFFNEFSFIIKEFEHNQFDELSILSTYSKFYVPFDYIMNDRVCFGKMIDGTSLSVNKDIQFFFEDLKKILNSDVKKKTLFKLRKLWTGY